MYGDQNADAYKPTITNESDINYHDDKPVLDNKHTALMQLIKSRTAECCHIRCCKLSCEFVQTSSSLH